MSGEQSDFKLLDAEAQRVHFGNRTQSTALLAWFLETVWRIEPEEVSDSICDGGGDKGIDAIEVNIDLREITVFQSKRRTGPTATQGDSDLRAFVGVAGYFESEQGIDALLESAPNPELVNLINRLDLRNLLKDGGYSVRLVYVTNAPLDAAGEDYVASREYLSPLLDVWDQTRLSSVARRTRSLEIQNAEITLPLASDLIYEVLGTDTRLAVTMVSANDLVRLPGISDLSIFELNVRLGLGRTRINRELSSTIKQPDEHPMFPAYHNGLTILTRDIDSGEGEITIDGVSVVNGCQSLLALYSNRDSLTPNLRVMVKFVELGDSLSLVDSITYRTNNQNAVNTRDLRSTDPIQRDLQAQVKSQYGDKLAYLIRSGEQIEAPAKLKNTDAAQLAMAVYVGEPWNAVRKVKLFDQEYHRVFNRELDGHKIFLLHLLADLVAAKRSQLRPDLEASFASVKFTFLYLIAILLKSTDQGIALLTSPEAFMANARDRTLAALEELAEDVVDSLNFYIETRLAEAAEDESLFDPKTVFKSKSGVLPLQRDVLQQARRSARRDPDHGFHVDVDET